MKQIVLMLLILTAITLASNAQEVNRYEAEHTTYFEAKGYEPLSPILYYSDRGGGYVLKQDTADANGALLTTGDVDFNPAFALGKSNGQVRFFESKEFTFNDVSLYEDNSNVTISWNAAMSAADAYSFEILKSMDSVSYAVIGTVGANDSVNVLSPYVFIDENAVVGALYRVRVVGLQKGTRYTTQPMGVNSAANRGVNTTTTNASDLSLKIYPTATRDVFTVMMSEPNKSTSYKIVNEQGQTLQSGKTDKQEFTLSIASFAAGNYFVVVQTGKKKTTGRVVKL